jgi:hypothetical protein
MSAWIMRQGRIGMTDIARAIIRVAIIETTLQHQGQLFSLVSVFGDAAPDGRLRRRT